MTDTITTPQPTTTQLLVALAGALAPLAGPSGEITASVVNAGIALFNDVQAKQAAGVYTMADLEAAAAKTTVDLAQLKADVDALPT